MRRDTDPPGAPVAAAPRARQATSVSTAELAAQFRAEAARADAQAATALTTAWVAAALAVGDGPCGWARWPWWAGLAAGAVGTWLLGAALLPRRWRARPAGEPVLALLCAWDVLDAHGRGELAEAHGRDAPEGAERAQLLTLARIVERKFRYVRGGLLALGVAGMLCGLALAAG